MLNDCLSLSVNQLLRQRFFVQREQIQRLWKQSLCASDSYVNVKKIDYGVSITAFKNLFVNDSKAYSINMVKDFKGKDLHEALR